MTPRRRVMPAMAAGGERHREWRTSPATAIRDAATLLIMALWLAADAALFAMVVVDWWRDLQHVAVAAPGPMQAPQPSERPAAFPRPAPPPPALVQAGMLVTRYR